MKALLFDLLRYAVWGEGEVDREIAEKEISEVYALAKKHDLAQTLAYAYEKLGITDDLLTREKDIAVFRTEKIKFITEEVSAQLTEAKIPHIPLKGACIRRLYPEEWMRPSCDVDVYVDPSRVNDASKALEKAGYVMGRRHVHDIAFTSPGGCTVELHFVLAAEGEQKKAWELLKNVWEYTVPDGDHRYRMNAEMTYFYHLSHMARHVQTGGCGIRPFIDMRLIECHRERAEALLEQGGLAAFEKIARQLSDVWFSDGVHDDVTEALEEYILTGAVYGTSRNAAASKGSRSRYILSRIFMPYSELKLKYPFLNGKPYLMPWYTFRRWCNLLKRKKIGSSMRELKASSTVSVAEMKKIGALFKKLEL